jgi:hypothetical protein
MKKYVLTAAVLLICLFAITSCEKKPTGPPEYHPTDYFPNQVGMWWSYSIIDRNDTLVDQVDIVIEGETTLSDGTPVMIWVYYYNNHLDTGYVYVDSHTVIFYSIQTVHTPNEFYMIPLEVGNEWLSNGPNQDPFIVTAKSSLSVPAGRFHNTFQIDLSWNYFENAGTQSAWITPQVGIVKRHEHGFANYIGSYCETWLLTSYDISP